MAVCSYALGIAFGALAPAMKLSGWTALRMLAGLYTTAVRGLPELPIIYLVFFGGGAVLRGVARGLFGYGEFIDLPIFVTGMICIGFSAGAYAAEVIRGLTITGRLPGPLATAWPDDRYRRAARESNRGRTGRTADRWWPPDGHRFRPSPRR